MNKMLNIRSLAVTVLASAGVVVSTSIVQFDCYNFETNGGSQAEQAYYGIPTGRGDAYCQHLSNVYFANCAASDIRCSSFPTIFDNNGDGVVISAFAQNHDESDVQGCLDFSIDAINEGLGFTKFSDRSFTGCIDFGSDAEGEPDDPHAHDELRRRQIRINPEDAAQIGDIFTLSNGKVLTIQGLFSLSSFDANVQWEAAKTIIGDVSEALVAKTRTLNIRQQGGFMGAIPGNQGFVSVSFDGGINEGIGSMAAQDWKLLLGSILQNMANASKTKKMRVFCTINGAVALGLTVGLLG